MKLFVFVEGSSDERFFRFLARYFFKKWYSEVLFVKYANQKTVKVNAMIRAINQMPDNEYIFVTDYDRRNSVYQRKDEVRNRYHELHLNRIFIVIDEIESWYLAGIPTVQARAWSLPILQDTQMVTKEDFALIIPERFSGKIEFCIEILKQFDIKWAERCNGSFKYFMQASREGFMQ